MQKKIIATLAVASVIGISCKWFAPKADNKQPFNIVGKWQVDSVYQIGSDSSKNWLALAFLDSTIGFKFNVDSTLNLIPSKYSNLKIPPNEVNFQDFYYLRRDTLFIKEDTTFDPYIISQISDSLINLTSKDSFTIVLKRQ